MVTLRRSFHRLIIILTALISASAAVATPPLRDGAWYGTNYTAPFAHAYRALGSVGVDRKTAIDRDVYHLSRLGLNAFRLHLWDVELTDSAGNLLDNDHLDLLDYLIARLKERGIDIILTAQTNFGNGYPDRDTDPNGAYSYRYPKCGIHEDPEAVEAQSHYIGLLAQHVNPYNGLSLSADPSVIAMEINNEPCHEGASADQVEAYIALMVNTLRAAGWEKPVLYNASHNFDVTEAFFRAPVDGVTFQWYPLGLVSGHTRHGNFLPYVDEYDIPFDTIPGFDRPAKIIYEYDPADNLAAYVYPAAVRTLRGKGFSWITQFAYDPIDIARFNTEYQTHFLNLAYTPGKAIAMMIAGEVMRRTPIGADYGKYPADTVFGPFTVSARRDLAVMNTPDTFLYSNTTLDHPVAPGRLRMVAGTGSSPVVDYHGTGAYFIDLVAPGVWRLELMPDVTLIADPFAPTSLDREVAVIDTAARPITLRLPSIGPDYLAVPVTRSNQESVRATEFAFTAAPGVYLLTDSVSLIDGLTPSTPYGDGHRRIGEYVMPPMSKATVNEKPVTAKHPASARHDTLPLIDADDSDVTESLSLTAIPGRWEGLSLQRIDSQGPDCHAVIAVKAPATDDPSRLILEKYIAHLTGNQGNDITDRATIDIIIAPGVEGTDSLQVSLVDTDGFTYSATVTVSDSGDTLSIPLSSLTLSPTLLNPEPFPTFLSREFIPASAEAAKLRLSEAELLRISIFRSPGKPLFLPFINAVIRPPGESVE